MDVSAVVAALRAMVMPEGLTACELAIGYDESTEQLIAHVALVLKYDDWNNNAIAACELARSAAWDALASTDVVPNLLCRTATEHAELRMSEPQWLPIADGNC
jgi:hypothetical protein